MEHEYEDCSCQVLSEIVEAALLFPVRPLFRLAVLVQLCDWTLWYGSSSSLTDDPSNIELFSFSSRRALSVILVQGFLPKDMVLVSDLQEVGVLLCSPPLSPPPSLTTSSSPSSLLMYSFSSCIVPEFFLVLVNVHFLSLNVYVDGRVCLLVND